MMQLVVHGDSQSLKGLGRGMVLAAAFFDILNQLGKLAGSFKGLYSPRRCDRQRDPAGLELFAEITQNLFQVSNCKRVDNLIRVQRLTTVHAHVESSLPTKAEASLE